MNRLLLSMTVGCLLASTGCKRNASPPIPPDLPPAYPRALITDPHVAEAAKEFTEWVKQQQMNGKAFFERIEVLPPVPTLQPYGVGTYEKVTRLPVVLTTGPGWEQLSAERREEITATAFKDLSDRLVKARTNPTLSPTLTIQTRAGLELAWVNDLVPGRRLLHGDGE